MNFKKFTIVFLALLMVISLAACAPHKGAKNYTENTFLLKVPGRQDLYYDPDEKVVYIVFNEGDGYAGYGYMSPYYSHNGYPYLYDPESNTLIEIKGG